MILSAAKRAQLRLTCIARCLGMTGGAASLSTPKTAVQEVVWLQHLTPLTLRSRTWKPGPRVPSPPVCMSPLRQMTSSPCCTLEPLLLQNSHWHPSFYSTGNPVSSSGGGSTDIHSLISSDLLSSLTATSAVEPLDALLSDDGLVVGGNGDEYSSNDSTRTALNAPDSVQLPGYSDPLQLTARTAKAASNGAPPPFTSGCGAELPAFDVADWPNVDLQELLLFSDSELLAPFSVDGATLHPGASTAPHSSSPPPSLVPSQPASAAAMQPQSQATQAMPGEPSLACCTPPQLAPASAYAVDVHSLTPEPALAPLFGSAMAAAIGTPETSSSITPQLADAQALAVPPAGGNTFGAEAAGTSNDGAAQPVSITMRGGRKRRSVSSADADAPKQLEEYEKKQALKQEQNRRNQESCRARKKVRLACSRVVCCSVWLERTVLPQRSKCYTLCSFRSCRHSLQ